MYAPGQPRPAPSPQERAGPGSEGNGSGGAVWVRSPRMPACVSQPFRWACRSALFAISGQPAGLLPHQPLRGQADHFAQRISVGTVPQARPSMLSLVIATYDGPCGKRTDHFCAINKCASDQLRDCPATPGRERAAASAAAPTRPDFTLSSASIVQADSPGTVCPHSEMVGNSGSRSSNRTRQDRL